MSGTGTVAFDYAFWQAQYPQLAASVPPAQALGFWAQAGLYLDNTGCSPIVDATPYGKRAIILYMITSHIAALFATINGNAPSPLVGRINSASEGSVSVQTDVGDLPGSAQWFAQTPYGFAAWQAMAPYRTALYIAPPQQPLGWLSYPPFILPVNAGPY
ncbi:MAG: DUF4054 domain-containing protein [Rhodopila sp.]|nr:DUF4054 domain-containing protein [Rhodopila sp.]